MNLSLWNTDYCLQSGRQKKAGMDVVTYHLL